MEIERWWSATFPSSESSSWTTALRGERFPIAYECSDSSMSWETIEAWIVKERSLLLEQAFQSGAVLFRGFPLRTPEDFDRFIQSFGLENFPYDESLSNAVRVNKTPRVFTANEAPPTVSIFLHHEMAQTPIYPSRLFFFCEQSADTGGATALCRSDVLWKRIVQEFPAFAGDCERKGLRYSNVMPSSNDAESGMGRSWQSTLRVTSKDQAEARLTELGYTWTWLDEDSLRATTPVLPAVRDLQNGRQSFFNQLIAAFKGWKDKRNDPSKAITFGDGKPLDRPTVDEITKWADELCFDLVWQNGDVALIDNYVVMHGRRTSREHERFSLRWHSDELRRGEARGYVPPPRLTGLVVSREFMLDELNSSDSRQDAATYSLGRDPPMRYPRVKVARRDHWEDVERCLRSWRCKMKRRSLLTGLGSAAVLGVMTSHTELQADDGKKEQTHGEHENHDPRRGLCRLCHRVFEVRQQMSLHDQFREDEECRVHQHVFGLCRFL